jgi:nucleolin
VSFSKNLLHVLTPCSFGFVDYADIESAKAAYEALNGSMLDNRSVILDYSQPRPERPASGGGRGGRGGGRGGRGGRGGHGGW